MHFWHEQSCRILIFFVTEPDLVGQLKLINEPPWLPELDALVLAVIWSQSRSAIEKYKITEIRIFEADSL